MVESLLRQSTLLVPFFIFHPLQPSITTMYNRYSTTYNQTLFLKQEVLPRPVLVPIHKRSNRQHNDLGKWQGTRNFLYVDVSGTCAIFCRKWCPIEGRNGFSDWLLVHAQSEAGEDEVIEIMNSRYTHPVCCESWSVESRYSRFRIFIMCANIMLLSTILFPFKSRTLQVATTGQINSIPNYVNRTDKNHGTTALYICMTTRTKREEKRTCTLTIGTLVGK